MRESFKKLLDKDFGTALFYVMLYVYVLAFSFTGLGYDYDYWARISVGKFFMQTGLVPKQDFFSYTPTHVWYDHEWGSGVVFYIVNKLSPESTFPYVPFTVISLPIQITGTTVSQPFNLI